ncbi:asparaginase, partial [Candidatus Curtissbacteria bacterium]|nr:asparaginase [Candidatus Curtissbacteria bacterium]
MADVMERPPIDSRDDILVVHHGGTGGFRRTPQLELVVMTPEELVHGLHPDLQRRYRFGFLNFAPGINSADVSPSEHWSRFALMVPELRKKYKAAVIVMGTNTAPDTGSAQAFALGPHNDFPMVYVASQRHHDRLGSHAKALIEESVIGALAASRAGLSEILLNSGLNTFIRAVNASKRSDNEHEIFDA